MSSFDRFQRTFLNWDVIAQYWPDIVSGLWLTLELSVAIIIAGIALGLFLAFARSFANMPVRLAIIGFADIFRALPPLVLILLLYFGFPSIGIILPGPVVLFVVLALVLAAFAEEIFWAGIASVHKGQWEAGRSTGLTKAQALVWIVLPQAIRLTIPPLANRAIAITKMTALGTVIGVPELLNQASTAQSFSSNASPLTVAAAAYIVLFLPFVIFARWLEKRFSWKRA